MYDPIFTQPKGGGQRLGEAVVVVVGVGGVVVVGVEVSVVVGVGVVVVASVGQVVVVSVGVVVVVVAVLNNRSKAKKRLRCGE